MFIADVDRRKSYSFSEVRSWNYAVLAGGATLGGKMEDGPVGQLQAFVTAREFFRVTHQNKVGSGLFVEVRDVEHPKWRINFKRDKVMEKELLRWMEILRQNINENQ